MKTRLSPIVLFAMCLAAVPFSVHELQAQVLTGQSVEVTSGSPDVEFIDNVGTAQFWRVVGFSGKFAVEDKTGLPSNGDDVFVLTPGARENSLFVDTGGLLGLGTNLPLALLDIRASLDNSFARFDPGESTTPSIDVFEQDLPAELVLETAASKSSRVTMVAPNVDISLLANSNGGTPKFLIRDSVNAKNMVTIFPGPNNNNTLTIKDGKVGIKHGNPQHPLHMISGARCTTGGVWTNACSRDLKDNIQALTTEQALQAFAALDPVTYHYKSSPAEMHVGFIAEDVPELIATGDRKGLAAMDVVALLTKVVQEQDQQIQQMAQAQQEQSELSARLLEEISLLRSQLERN